MDTSSVLLLLFCCYIQPVISIKIHSRYDEPTICTSRFDFEEKLLEKMVKISHKFDMLTEVFEKQDTRLFYIEERIKGKSRILQTESTSDNLFIGIGSMINNN